MAASNQLTTLANAKSWLGVSTTNDDALLTRLIGSASRFILSYLERPSLFQTSYTDIYDGVGNRVQMLRNWPVISVSSLLIGGQTITAAPSITGPGCGYVLEPSSGQPPGRPQALTLRGYEFWRGYSNVQAVYSAGYIVQKEAQTVPGTPFQVTVNAPYGNWAVDQGVTYANGVGLALVSSGPTTGQYSVANGVYAFSAGDANVAVLISYSYIPADIEQACIEMVGERYNYKSRIGVVSKSLGGQETMTYSQKDMSAFVSSMLVPYRSVILV